jgi:hypothetical protein
MSSKFKFLDENISYKPSKDFERFFLQIEAEIKALPSFKRWHSRYSDHLRVIILNLIYCYQSGEDVDVAYFRGKYKYQKPKRYSKLALRYDSIVKIADALLDDLGYIQGKKGYYNRIKKSGEISRMKFTPSLIVIYNKYMGKKRLTIREEVVETIILRDINKEFVDYKDDATITELRKKLKIINYQYKDNFIGLYITDEMFEELCLDVKDKGYGQYKTTDFSRNTLVRVFNNSSFCEGGRFYRGWWQSIPSVYRKHIRINDETTCELDFSGMHINMIYASEGLPLPKGDVYELDDVPVEARPVLKGILQIILNAPSEQKARQAIYKKFPKKEHPNVFVTPKITHKSLIDGLREKHKLVGKYFCSGEGVKLQYRDSQIAEEVLLTLARKGVVALPVHDSFIVAKNHKKDLLEAMDAALILLLGASFGIKANETAYEQGRKLLMEEVMPEDMPKSERHFEMDWIAEPHNHYALARDSWFRG